jgi:hypothetical protein
MAENISIGTCAIDRMRSLTECCRALIEAAANNTIEEVYCLATPLCAFNGTGRSIISASPVQQEDGTVTIGAFFKPLRDSERFPPPKNPRHFDIMYFAAMRLMDAVCAPNSGQGFFYQPLPPDVDGIAKYYLRYGNGGREPGARVYVTRIIVDASAGSAARFAEKHHSYCRADLLTVTQHNPRLAPGEHGRGQAIRLACEMFGDVSADREGITSFEYEAVLLNLLKSADQFHGAEYD